MPQPPVPEMQQRLRRRPRTPSASPSTTSSARPTSRPRTESAEPATVLTPTVSPPALSMRERCPNTTSPSPAQWQYPSCSRCIVCGRLGCDTCSVKVDPTLIKQKLDSLRLSTPYERAKQERITEELCREEQRQRQRVMDRYEAWRAELRTLELLGRQLVWVTFEEETRRHQVWAEEQARRTTYVLVCERRCLVLELQANEASTRHVMIAEEREQFARLTHLYAFCTEVWRLFGWEALAREKLCYSETSAWQQLRAAAVKGRTAMRERAMERHTLETAYTEERDKMCQQRCAELDDLCTAAAAHRELIRQHLQQQWLSVVEAEKAKRDIASEESSARQRLRAEMLEEADYLDECHRIFERQRVTLLKSEASQRSSLYAEAESGYHMIFLDMKANEEEAHAAEAEKADRRQTALLRALDTLCTIQHDEHVAFTALLQKKKADLMARYAWGEQKPAARTELLRQCVAEKEDALAVEEARHRAALRKAMTDGEVAVEAWRLSKAHARDQFCAAAFDALSAVTAEEHKVRFQLLSDMATHEKRVRHWCEEKRQTQWQFLEEEHAARRGVAQQEEERRHALGSGFQSECKALADRAMQHAGARVKALKAAVESLFRVTAEEDTAWCQLRVQEGEHRHRAIDVFHFRCQMELLHAETQHRAMIAQDETAARAEMRTKMSLSVRYAVEATLATLRVQLTAVAAAEESVRFCFYEQVGEWYDWAAAQQREEELQLIVALEQRIAEELRARQTYMVEDARLYDAAEEPLVMPHSTQQLDGYGDDGAGSGFARGLGGMHDVRRALVLQTLGNPVSVAPLSSYAVDFLVAVIDQAGRRRDVVQEALVSAQRLARDASKRLVQQERLLAAAKDKKEMYDASTRREGEERERRRHQEAQDKARSQQTLLAEKRRLADVRAELKEQQTKLEALKSSINKQYSR